MAKVDLNIIDRGIQDTKWILNKEGIKANELSSVIEQKTDNSAALNSLPTPFARFFVAKEAFRRVMEERIDPKKEAGFAYRQMVSDILDVFELLFNLKYHRNNTWTRGQNIELREWDYKENSANLKKRMPILFNSINEYYQTDINEDKLFFLLYNEDGKERLLATSSPLTGFVTPPDMDKSQIKKEGTVNIKFAGNQYADLHIHRKSGGKYFRDIKLFEDRDLEFKNYMFNVLFGSDNVDSRFKTLKEYIHSFRNDTDIRNDIQFQLTNVMTDQNNELVINGLSILSSNEIDIDSFFTPTLIRIPYRIDRENFSTVKYQNDSPERDYDFLLPFKPEVINLFEDGNINTDIHINRNSVTVSLYYKGKTYKKEYAEDPNPLKSGIGFIYNLSSANINFDLGLFPNVLSNREEENNYFKVLVIGADEDPNAPQFNIDKISLSFFKGKEKINEMDPLTTGARYGVLPAVVRSRQKTNTSEGGTKFYELYNTSFNMIEVNIQGYTGLCLLNWKPQLPTNDTYTYAIDLGTSNTFISRCKNGENNLPELFKMDKPMVSYLHESPKNQQFSPSKVIESAIFEKAQKRIKTEFLPAFMDGEDYKFPIRTALCGVTNKAVGPKLFDNYNIAFFYEKLMANDDQQVFTDIKWDKNDQLLRVFIQELLLIIKCDVLQRNGDLDLTKLVWFRPLSFMGNTRSIYQEIWTTEPQRILSIQSTDKQIVCFSESEAPYYFFKKKNYIPDSDAVSVIDIGGGSTDFVYFADNKPKMANSVHFGCDVLWSNGFIGFVNARDNGIYLRYKDTLRFKRDDLNSLNVCLKNVNTVSTKDIINFWLSNSDYCDIKKNLSQDYKPVFIYHLTSILFYMANMYKDLGFDAPKTIVFSGNGSKYIDGFICSDKQILKKIIDKVFNTVYGGEHNVYIELPNERKESTCYGGLYRDTQAPDVPEKYYQGDNSANYETVGDINNNFEHLKTVLANKYSQFNVLYKEILDLLKQEHIIDNTANTSTYVEAANEDMLTPLKNYFKTQINGKYDNEVTLYDTVFFLPIIDRIFKLTKI